jgi:peptidyl-prolyl cis-trans isomerase SurA
MKNILLRMCITVAAVACTQAFGDAPQREHLDGIAAVVGDELVLVSELEAYMLMRLNEMKVRPDTADLQKLREQFLDEMIEGKVLLAHARQDSTIRVQHEEVEAALEDHIERLLKANNLTMERLKQDLAAQGLTVSKFRKQLRRGIEEQLLRRNVHQRYFASVNVARRDVEAFYEEYRDSLPSLGESFRMLKLTAKIPTPDSARQAAYERIKKVKTRLDNGEDFEELARMFSEDPSSESGGDLGFVAKGTLSELTFEDAVFSLEPGEVSDIFETRLGFHVAKAVVKRDQKVRVKQILIRVTPPASVREKVSARLDSIRTSSPSDEQFAKAVKKYSDDPQTKARGGDMGWVTKLQMPESYLAAFDTLAVGTVSKPVEDEEKLTIFFIKDHVEEREVNLNDDYDILAQKARDILAQKKMAELVSRWRKELFIDIRLQ